MKTRLARLFAISIWITLSLPAAAGVVYEDGPINGTVDAWTINDGFFVGDTFTVSSGTTNINGISFGAWLFPGDTLESVEVQLQSHDFHTTYFDEMVNFTASGCTENQYGYDVCTETGMFNGPTLPVGTYWLIMQNAVVSNGDPVYWDENSGVGCQSPGCPSQTILNEGSIPAESFTVLGGPAGTTPEAGSILLFGSGIVGVAGVLRRRFTR